MSDEDKETQELEQRMRLAMQKAGFIIPSDLDVDEELPAEAMRAKIPEELSDIDAAMNQILSNDQKPNIVSFPAASDIEPFAIAARNGKAKLSEETLRKLKRTED